MFFSQLSIYVSTGTKGRVTEEDHHSRSRGGRAEARGLAGTSSRRGQSAASMETMEMEDQTHMQGGPSTTTMRTELKEHADSYHSGARETRVKGTVTGRRRRSSVDGVGTAQERQTGQRNEEEGSR
ncbi:uncharacterized protein UDID_18816 [Ustilago sp. UG-2017a]|nr:uncharacterized protein UDID_18816 [Ustilago sp. UG-2017a]